MRFPTDSHYVVRVRWGTHSLIQITETNTSIVNQLFLNSLAQNTAWNRISKYKIRSLHVVFQSMVCYQLGSKPTYKRRILLRLYHENINITNITRIITNKYVRNVSQIRQICIFIRISYHFQALSRQETNIWIRQRCQHRHNYKSIRHQIKYA